MQRQRFEHKYLLSEARAGKVRDFVSSYLELDENSAGRPNDSYPVHSLYLDSDNLATYWMTVNGNKRRFKLRLRFYDNKPSSPVYFEIKSRVDRVIFKERAAVRKEAAWQILDGQWPEPSWLFSSQPKPLAALSHFVMLAERLQARPKVHVGYQRQAWIDPRNDAVRVTLDRHVVVEPEPDLRFSTRLLKPCLPFGREVILELKFTDRYPNWFQELTETFDLMQCGAAKYCEGVTLLGEKRLGHRLNRFADAGLSPDTLLNVSLSFGHEPWPDDLVEPAAA
jgi:hypothetical protein